MKNYLNFESDIKNLESEIEKLKDPYNQDGLSEVDTQKISTVQTELDEKLKDIYSNLDPWQTTMVARHEDRPKSKFFIDNLFEDFISLSGDRYYGEDKSVIPGLAEEIIPTFFTSTFNLFVNRSFFSITLIPKSDCLFFHLSNEIGVISFSIIFPFLLTLNIIFLPHFNFFIIFERS